MRIGSLDVDEAAVDALRGGVISVVLRRPSIFARDGTLLAQPFDADARHTTGDAFPIAAGVSWEGKPLCAAQRYRATGTLVYSRNNSQAAQPLTWFDRQGRVLRYLGPAMPYVNLQWLAQQRRIAVAVGANGANRNLWLIDIRSQRAHRVKHSMPAPTAHRCGRPTARAWSVRTLACGPDDGSLRQKMIGQPVRRTRCSSEMYRSDTVADGLVPRWAIHRLHSHTRISAGAGYLGAAALRRSENLPPGANRISRVLRGVLSGRTVVAYSTDEGGQTRRLCAAVPARGWEISDLHRRRQCADLASGRQGALLPRGGRNV